MQVYVEDHLDEVPGWSGTARSMLMLERLAAIQDPSCAALGAFEIGVHHGRYLIALHNACAPGSRSLGVDLFEDQDRNTDRSGHGDLERAEANVARFAREPDRVELRSGDSLALTPEDAAEIARSFGGFRFTSVDGGHTAAHVVNDTKLAARLTHAAGFIIIDDFFSPNFPGATEGIYRLLESYDTPFIPVLVTAKKLFLGHTSFAHGYVRTISNEPVRPTLPKMKLVKIAGYPCMSVAA